MVMSSQVMAELQGARKLIERELLSIEQKVVDVEAELRLESQCEEALEYLAQQGSDRLTRLVLIGLSVIYGSDYRFRRVGRDILVDDGHVEVDMIDGRGGGLTDVVSLLLRVLALRQGKGGALETLVLDEPLRSVDKETALRASGFLLKIAERMGVNVLMVTHRDELVEDADFVFAVRRRDGKTELSPVERG